MQMSNMRYITVLNCKEELEYRRKQSLKTFSDYTKSEKKAFIAIDGSGFARIDFFVENGTNKVYLNEINTVPGSLAYYLFCDTIKDFSKMLSDIIECGVAVHNKHLAKQHVFKSSVLEIEGLKSKGIKTFDRKN